MNVILILVDTLRPDHLKINGYHRNTSPNIDKLAKESTSFSNTYCALPRSDPSMATILTGMYPHSHGLRLVTHSKVDFSLPHLAEILNNHGFKTAFMGGGPIHHPFIREGFDEYNLFRWKAINKFKRGIYKILNPKNFLSISKQFTDIAVRWISRNTNKKFFLCLHYEDLHWPYRVPKPFEDMFDPDYRGDHFFNNFLDGGKLSRGDIIFGNVKLPKEEIMHAIAHYDGGIRYIDAQIGRVLNIIEQKKLKEKTLIILTSDHGENFGEHEFYLQHGASIYEPSLRVPLFFSHPNLIPKGKVINAKIQNTGIMPTVLDILNIPLIDQIDGKSLLPLINGETKEGYQVIFAESIEEHFKGNKRVFMKGVKGKWRTMIFGDWKIILIPHPEENIFELYNLKEDPEEKNNLIDKEKKVASEMKQKILKFIEPQKNEGGEDLGDLTEKSKKLLKKIGYID